MSLCPVCGNYLCDHTSFERGQTSEEMMAPLSQQEVDAWKSGDQVQKKATAIEVKIKSIHPGGKESESPSN